MTVLQFGPWEPDKAAFDRRGIETASNVLPAPSGYGPMPSLVATTNALDARPRGAITARDSALVVFQFAGDAAKLYQNVSNTWTDRSKAGGYSTSDDERWEFVVWKNKVLATNFSDDPQQIEMGATVFSDLTTDFKARHITTIRDFVVVANTNDSSDGNVPSRVRWSAFNDETDWTVSASTLSDFQDLKTAPVERIFGGEFGVIFQPNSVWRMTFVGAPVVFQFDEVLPGIGLIAPGAAARDGNTVFFLSTRGFFALESGTQATPIGANRVDDTILSDLDETNLDRISAAMDPAGHRFMLAYPGAGNIDGRPNKIAVYDRTLDRWSLIEIDVELLWRSSSLGFDLDTDMSTEDQNLDADLPGFDSRFYVGGALQIAAFAGDFKSGLFNGAAMTGTVETAETQLTRERRTRVSAFRPLVDGGTPKARVGTRNRQTDEVSWTPTLINPGLTQRASGRYNARSNARYHRFRLEISGDWTQAMGVEVTDFAPGGRR